MRRALVGWEADEAVLRVDEPLVADIGELGMTATEIWKTDSAPPDLYATAPTDTGRWELEPPTAGTVFRVVTFPPGRPQASTRHERSTTSS